MHNVLDEILLGEAFVGIEVYTLPMRRPRIFGSGSRATLQKLAVSTPPCLRGSNTVQEPPVRIFQSFLQGKLGAVTEQGSGLADVQVRTYHLAMSGRQVSAGEISAYNLLDSRDEFIDARFDPGPDLVGAARGFFGERQEYSLAQVFDVYEVPRLGAIPVDSEGGSR